MNREELQRMTGSIQQLAYIRPSIMEEGRARGMKVYDIKNGRLQFKVMADKCLDIGELSYGGENISFLSKGGLIGRTPYDTNGMEAQRSIMGGMLFTCGLTNICAPCQAGGTEYPMHGRIRTTPAEHVSAGGFWEGEEYRMEVSGVMREARLFGENLVLNRRINTTYPGKSIIIEDKIENEGFREEPFLMLYHFNIGYPFLNEDTRVILPSRAVKARDEESRPGLASWEYGECPIDNQPEYVFLHELAGDPEGNTFAAAFRPDLGFGIKISFNKREFPWFMQWKSLASGDYVMGLEPANASVYGKKFHLSRGDHPVIGARETRYHRLIFTILGPDEFVQLLNEKEKLLKGAY